MDLIQLDIDSKGVKLYLGHLIYEIDSLRDLLNHLVPAERNQSGIEKGKGRKLGKTKGGKRRI